MAPNGHQNGNRKGLAGGPIPVAIAAAILICAVPLAYRILQCEQFDSGFSLERFFTFKCERSVGASPPAPKAGASAPVASGAPSGGGPATASTALTGFVYYEEKGRRPTGVHGVYTAAGTDGSPSYEALKAGMVLKTVSTSRVRSAPGRTENIIDTLGGGKCVKLLQPPSRPAQGLTDADSGGWLMVQATPCPD